ncbi:hypothetical protein FQN49_005407 [Arthroderma sp. PD_2]|nr:hypothetical protein FQN49_005407 [Arthroderma sp. PD_2]
MAVGSILGPIIGALFSEYVPGGGLGLAFFCLRVKAIERSFRSRLVKLDWAWMGLFGAGSVAFSMPLSWAGAMYPRSSWRTIVHLAIGTALLVAVGFYERKPALAVFPYRIFQSRTALVTMIGGFLHGAVLYTVLLYLPLFFQAVFLESPLQSAVSMIPFCCIQMAFSGISAVAVQYVRRYTWGIWTGWILLAAGVGLFAIWDGGSSRAEIAGFQVISATGLGALFTILTIPIQASAPNAEDQGLSVGLLVSFRLFGALVGLAMGATTFNSVFGRSISSDGGLEGPIAIVRNPSEAVGFIPHLKEIHLDQETRATVQRAYRNVMQAIWYILTGFGGAGLLTSLWTKELGLETEKLGRQHFEGRIEQYPTRGSMGMAQSWYQLLCLILYIFGLLYGVLCSLFVFVNSPPFVVGHFPKSYRRPL